MMRGIILGIICIISFCLGYNLNKCSDKRQIETISDTIYIEKVDTIRDTVLVPKYQRIRDTVKDTLYVPELSKPAEVEIPISEYCFKDSTYSITMTGYRVNAKEIEIYPRTKYIYTTNTVVQTKRKSSRFSFGLQAGYGYALSCNKFSPYVGLGGQLNFFSF